MDGAKDGGFEARKREVETRGGAASVVAIGTGKMGVGKMVFMWIARGGFGGGAVLVVDFAVAGGGDIGATGVGKTENFGDFVETFADGIVAGGADDLEGVVGRHMNNLGMATRDD